MLLENPIRIMIPSSMSDVMIVSTGKCARFGQVHGPSSGIHVQELATLY